MNIDQIAKLAGVSTATVSRVVNGSNVVRDSTAARIREVIAAVGYVPNQSARTLTSGQSRLFAAIIADVINPWVAELLHEFELECAAHHYDAVFASSGHQASRMKAALQRMIERQVEGIAIFTSEMDVESAALILRHDIPVCGLAYGLAESAFPILRIDYYTGIEQAITHLKSLGHKDIGFIAGPRTDFSSYDRVNAFHLAMATVGLSVCGDWIREGDFRMSGGIAATASILNNAKKPTALLCSNDAMALGALRTIRRAGLRVPQDLSVIGIDDLESAALADPPLTTIRIPRRELAQLAFENLFGASMKTFTQPQERTVLTSLVIRESTAHPARRARNKI